MLQQDVQSLDRGLLAYSPISKLKTGASTEFDVVVTDIGRGPQLYVITRVHGLVVYQQDVPTGGIVGVQAVESQNLTFIPESSSRQPVLYRGDSATWVWQITAGTPGPAEIILRADTYDQGSQQTLREEIIPITGMIVPTPALNHRQSHPKIPSPAKSRVNLIVTVAIAAAIVAGGIISWLIMKRRQRKHKMPGVGRRIKLWLRVLRAGVKPLDTMARWIAVAVLLLGVAGITVTLVLHLPGPLTVIILMGLLLVVVLEGAYQIWDETDQGRLSAEAARDAAQQKLEARRLAHGQELAKRKQTATEGALSPLEPHYEQIAPYRLPNANMIHHRIGIRNPSGNPEAVGVRVQWIEMSPRPRTDLGFPPVIPLAVPMRAGGDPNIGISLPPGQEELWVIATTATDENGAMTVGVFGPDRIGWHGTPWYFELHDRWRFTYRIMADVVPGRAFSVVMNAVDGGIRCDLEG